MRSLYVPSPVLFDEKSGPAAFHRLRTSSGATEPSPHLAEANGCGACEDVMTDKEVQKLNRKDLLELLLDAQSENEALRRERSELRKEVEVLEEELAVAKAARSTAAAAVPAAEPASPPAALQEEAAWSPRFDLGLFEDLDSREKELREREQRLWDRESHVAREEASVKKLLSAANSEAGHLLQDAEDRAEQKRRAAEDESARLLSSAESEVSGILQEAKRKAEEMVRKAESSAAVILRDADAAAAEKERTAASNAEKILSRAQEDSEAFWQDVSSLLLKQFGGSSGVSARNTASPGNFIEEGDRYDGL